MRIIIDVQGMQTQSRLRGIGRYTLSLTESIINNRGEHEIILALNGMFPETISPIQLAFEGLLPKENIKVWNAQGPVSECFVENTWRNEAAEFIRESFLESLNPDFILVTTLFEGFDDNFVMSLGHGSNDIATAVVLYDLIPLMNKEKYLGSPSAIAWYQNKISHFKRSRIVLAISESARREGIRYLDFSEDDIFNISTASSDEFKKIELSPSEQSKIRLKFGLSKNYLMYSGATDERKNHLALIASYAALPPSVRSHHQLAFIGGLPADHQRAFADHAKKCGLAEGELVISGRVSDHELICLYNLCKAFIFPSWHEGFGLPALEAMKCGRAVIASNTSSLPEVVGKSDALFDPFDQESITKKIEQVLTDASFRKALEQHSIEQAKTFTWDKTAKSAIAAMEKIHNVGSDNYKTKTQVLDSTDLHKSLIKKIAGLTSSFTDMDLMGVASSIAKNQGGGDIKQLLVDVSELVMVPDRCTGIQRVVRKVLTELLQSPPEGYRVEPVYARIVEGYRYAGRFKCDLLGLEYNDVLDVPVESKKGDIFLGLDLVHPKVLKKEFYQDLRLHGAKVFFVVYDLLPILLRNYSEDVIAEQFTEWMETVADCDGAICISESVAIDVSNWLKINRQEIVDDFKISWFHLGADIESTQSSESVGTAGHLIVEIIRKQPSFLMVGTVEPRKQQEQALEAFEQLWAKGLDCILVILGAEGWKSDVLVERLRNHSESGKRLFWIEGASDKYLEEIYAASRCLLAASEGEGFGLPLIEAAQYGMPILARDIPVFREVAGSGAYYFTGADGDSLASAIQNWMVLYQKNTHPKSFLIPWLTWEESARHLLACIGIGKVEG
jgi:glycosyltransferase involved in cell wall biosynthesis